MKLFKKICLGLLIVLLLYIIIQSIRCHIALKNSKKRLESYHSKTIELSYGNMTYVDDGEGDVVLSVHGITGGYDQAYDQASVFKNLDTDFRIIAPSRFGYLGSDVLGDGTPKEQAKAFIELLDNLNIDKVYVLASSAGGAPAIRFALDYPERTKGLILYSSGMPATEKPEKVSSYSGPPEFVLNDYIMYMFSPLFGPLMGMDSDIINDMLPIKDRKEGIILDSKITNGDTLRNFDDYHVEDLKNPTIIFQAKDDKLVNYDKAKEGAKRFPNATIITFEDGGHLLKGHNEEIKEAINNFIKEKN